MFRSSLLAGVVVAALLALSPAAPAADMSVKAAPIAAGYPNTRCGFYYGLGTGGSAGPMNGAVVGAQIVQGELDALVGYTCPFGASGFWFVEASAGFNNINGSVNGLALSGPLVLMQRAGAGSPINALFNPFGNSLALPSLPILPIGVTPGAANPYAFVGIVEQDISAQLVGGHTHQWVIAPMIGIGLLTRLNGNGAIIDTWAGWQMNSQAFYPALDGKGARLGNAGRVGVSFKY